MNFSVKKMLKNAKLYYTIITMIFLALLIHFITGFLFFPDEINLIAGTKHNFEFNVPVDATILNCDEAVINVNDQKVTENINIDLSKPFCIQSENEGSIDMRLSVLGIPVRNVKVDILPNIEVVPCGITVGVRIDTEGVMVLGIGNVHSVNGDIIEPSKGILKSGDLILKANDIVINNKEQLIDIIENCKDDEIKFTIKREDLVSEESVKLVKSNEDNKNKIGVWVRDSTQGIGTMTYYNPNTKRYGALGHGIQDVDTKKIMTVKSGDIMESKIISVKKGKKGSPGELLGDIEKENVIGDIAINTEFGIYGNLDISKINKFPNKKMPISIQDEIKEGPAKILSNIQGKEVKEYDAYIESVNRYNHDTSKGMVIRITDEQLLKDTNGIVQGMSGSPIIQNNKLIGAVTHVFVQEPTKGYGIFIENMLKQENLF